MKTELDWPTIQFDTGVRREQVQETIARDAFMDRQDPFDIIRITYPRIYNQIAALWGSQTLADQLSRWIFVDQLDRCGFDKFTLNALIRISNEHQQKFNLTGSLTPRPFKDTW